MAVIGDIPDELVVAIFCFLPSTDLALAVQCVSRRFYHLSQEPKLWLAHCRHDFVHWSAPSRARLARARAGRITRGPWKQMWFNRMRSDADSARHFEAVLASKVNRVRHLAAICSKGLDAKDFLLRQYHAADEADDDVLARHYYASTALGSLHRGLAIEEWCRVRTDTSSYSSLDRAIAAFDMFVLHDADEDMDTIEHIFDSLALEFRRDHPHLDSLTVRQKALALLRWVRARNLSGMSEPDVNYRNLRNCLIGSALTDPEHPSLPIISSVIYASIAERIGLRAYCSTVPGHVHVTVLGPPGETVDGTPLQHEPSQQPWPDAPRRRLPPEPALDGPDAETDDEAGHNIAAAVAAADPFPLALTTFHDSLRHAIPDDGERMFLDPYGSDDEVSLSSLRATLAYVDWGVGGNRDAFLVPSPTSAIVLRVALNLEASYTYATHIASNPMLGSQARQLRCGDPTTNLEALLYATVWASTLMRPLGTPGWERQLDSLLARFAHFYSEDVWIIERYIVPLYDRFTSLTSGTLGLHPVPPPNGGADLHIAGVGPGLGMPRGQLFGDMHDAHGGATPRRVRDWMDPREMIGMVYNLDRRQPVVSRRYTQDICNTVLYKVGQVFRHRTFGYIGIINGWTSDDPKSLPFPASMASAEMNLHESDDAVSSPASASSSASSPASKGAYYTCLRAGVERFVVAQANIVIVTDPDAIPDSLMFLAGKNFKRFDRATCTFVSNLQEFFPDD